MLDQIGTFTNPRIALHSGGFFDLLNPSPEDVTIEDIATATANICRYTGHVSSFYSVAEHSVRCSYEVPTELRMWALLHDATEAYIGDISRPLKQALEQVAPGVVSGIEARIMEAIAERFKLVGRTVPRLVKQADNLLLATERRDLMPETEPWPGLPEPLYEPIEPWPADLARSAFLARFYQLGGQ
jgi:hypothetical protein